MGTPGWSDVRIFIDGKEVAKITAIVMYEPTYKVPFLLREKCIQSQKNYERN